jgi:bacteriorhodopsin
MLYQSAYISLFIQFITGVIDYLGLQIDIPKEKNIYKDLLRTELGVQIIEFIFYIWMVYNFNNIKNITPTRYFDWIITKPVMLLTLTAYLDTNNYSSLKEYIKANSKDTINIILANLAMLIFGLVGELNYINYTTAITLGFIPFIYYFKLIYDKYIYQKNTTSDRKGLFYFFAVVWTLYGVVAYLPYEQKNISYNILDLFAKNLFGLILVYVVWKNRINKN